MQRYQPLEFRSVKNRIDCADDDGGEFEKSEGVEARTRKGRAKWKWRTGAARPSLRFMARAQRTRGVAYEEAAVVASGSGPLSGIGAVSCCCQGPRVPQDQTAEKTAQFRSFTPTRRSTSSVLLGST